MDQTNDNKEIEIDLGKIFYKMRNKFLIIIIITIVAAIVTGLVTQFCVTPKYTASTTMYVYANTDRISTDSSITSNELDASEDLVNTYIQILESDTVLEAVIDELDLNVSAASLRRTISASQVDKTVIFEVSVTTKSPQRSADIANAIAKIAPSEIVRVVKAGGVEIIDYAKVPSSQSSPNLKKNVAVAFLTAFVLSFAVFFLIELFDTTITSARDIEGDFDYPIIGAVPSLDDKSGNNNYYYSRKPDSSFSTALSGIELKPSEEILENLQNMKGEDK